MPVLSAFARKPKNVIRKGFGSVTNLPTDGNRRVANTTTDQPYFDDLFPASLIVDLDEPAIKCINAVGFSMLPWEINTAARYWESGDTGNSQGFHYRLMIIRNIRADLEKLFDPFFPANFIQRNDGGADRIAVSYYGGLADLTREDFIWDMHMKSVGEKHNILPASFQFGKDERITIILTPVYFAFQAHYGFNLGNPGQVYSPMFGHYVGWGAEDKTTVTENTRFALRTLSVAGCYSRAATRY